MSWWVHSGQTERRLLQLVEKKKRKGEKKDKSWFKNCPVVAAGCGKYTQTAVVELCVRVGNCSRTGLKRTFCA